MQAPIAKWVEKGVTFKFVGDNVDKHRGVRDIRSDNHSKLIHMYSLLAVKSRVCIPDMMTNNTLSSLPPSSFLPNEDDVSAVKLNLTILVSRILCSYIQCLAPFKKVVPMHIPHEYYEEMCEKSDTFFLDVLLKHEAKHEDMICIMKEQQNYLGKGYSGKVLSGGDQLTCERQCCAQRHVICGNTTEEGLRLLEPQSEDWHALMCFLSTLWKVLHKNSHIDHGTFGHLCGLLGRFSASKDPKKNMNACCDSLFIVLKGHYIATACKLLGITKPTQTPPDLQVRGMCSNAKMKYIATLARKVVEDCTVISESLLFKQVLKTTDGVYNYGRVFCHHASLALEFKDAWMEGDGERMCRCWKLFMLHFQSNGRTKYAWEALRQQFQLVTLPPSLAFQLKWSRFVNVHGGKGKNIPCDLFNEHKNKLFKEIIRSMGANMTEKSITRAARSVTRLDEITRQYDKESGVPIQTRMHSRKDDEHDVHTVCSTLLTAKVLDLIPGRDHTYFPKLTANPLPKLNEKKIKAWIERKKKESTKILLAQGEGDLSDFSATDDEESGDDHETETD